MTFVSRSLAQIASLSVVVLALASPGRAQPAGAPEDVVMAVPAVALTFSAGYLADDLGLFDKHGVRVKSVVIAGIGSTNAVISGSADFAQISAATLTRAAARGQRLLAIASTLNRVTVQLVLRKEFAQNFDPKAMLAQRAQLLRGRTIAVDSVNSILHAYALLVARRGNVDPNSVRIATMAPTSVLAAYAARQIDGYSMSMPWPLPPLLDGSAVLLASGPDGDPADMVPFGHNVVVAKPETCEKRKSACNKLGHAFAEAVGYMHEHPAESLALLKKRFAAFDDTLLTAAFGQILKGTPRPPAVSKAELENAEIYNVDAGLLRADEKLKSYDGLFTDAYVR